MLRNVRQTFIRVVDACCHIVHFFLVFGCDLIVGCYRSFLVQTLLTILETACFDVTGKVYYASGAAVGTAEGLWLLTRHVSVPLHLGHPLQKSVTGSLHTSTVTFV